MGNCFIMSATGKFSEAELVNLTGGGGEETLQMPVDKGPYNIEGMSGILGHHDNNIQIHAAVVHNCGDPPCDSAGGRLTRGVASSEGADFYIGEMTEERDLHET